MSGICPDPLTNVGCFFASPHRGEEVVISGMAGKFPECDNINEFRDHLYNKISLITEDNRRWSYDHSEMPKTSGKMLNIDRFDCGYFGLHYRQALSMDPMLRILLEKATEAIVDAGYHPSELKGTKTGVYVAQGISEVQLALLNEELHKQHYYITGLMLPNRLSYFLQLQGTSDTINTACSSYIHALNEAYRSIRCGNNDAALVAGVNLCLNPMVAQQYMRLGVLSKRGVCSPFDINADGYVRSEVAGVVFLQKAKDSRRVYAQLLHSTVNCSGFTQMGIKFPSTEAQAALFQELLQECNINPADVTYLEAHGTGTIAGDLAEANAIDAVFTKNRATPLLIGSIKSNIGHAEMASGFPSLVKVIMSMDYGLIPPTLNFTSPRPDIEPFLKDRIRVVTEKTPPPNNHGLFVVNNLGFGGAYAQTILKWNTKIKSNSDLPKDNLPRLVFVSGRTKEAVTTLMDALNEHRLDQEYIRLYHQVFSRNFNNHHYRGYTILTRTGENQRCIHNNTGNIRPLYLVFSSFSGSWMKLYEDLEQFPCFAQSVHRINEILINKNLNLIDLIQGGRIEKQKSVFNEIIGNLALQICFVDILKLLDVQLEGTSGLGLGQFVCGYFENCLTLEETITSVYEVASTISNNTRLTKDGIMNLRNNNFDKFKPQLVKNLSQVLKKPKARPCRWLSKNSSKIASVEFFLESICEVNVLPEILESNVLIFEIGNKHLVDLSIKYTIINFDSLSSTNGAILLLENLGNLYNLGHSMDLAKIYPKIDYPVSRSTPMISPFLRWNHSKCWPVGSFEPKVSLCNGERTVIIDVTSTEYSYISGHNIDGRILFPGTGYLYLVWEALSMQIGKEVENTRVVFKDCRFLRASALSKDHKLVLTITQNSIDGHFEVLEKDILLVSGKAFITGKIEEHQVNLPSYNHERAIKLSTQDIYKELRLRGYNYTGDFRSLIECCIDSCCAKIQWIDNWVIFMDNMLQMCILQNDTRNLSVSVSIQQISIDAPKHIRHAQISKDQHFSVHYHKINKLIKSGGIEVRGVNMKTIARKRMLEEPILENYQFIPFRADLAVHQAVHAVVQLALENTPVRKVRAVELHDEASNPNVQLIAPIINNALTDSLLIQHDVAVFTREELQLTGVAVENRSLCDETDCYLIVGTNLTKRPLELVQVIESLLDSGYVICRESLDFDPLQFQHPHLQILAIYTNQQEKLIFCQKVQSNHKFEVTINVDDSETFTWLPKLKEALKTNESVLIYSQNQPQCGILGFINCIRKEPGSRNIRAVFINDKEAPKFNQNDRFYKEQLQKQLSINVYQNGKWGTYRHFRLEQLREIECEHSIGSTLVKGDLSSLKWIQGPLKFNTKTEPSNKLIHIYYASLNFKDIMVASGRIDGECSNRYHQEFSQGLEFVGRDSYGQRVMGIAEGGALTNLLRVDGSLLWPVPKQWTMEEAATVPVVYVTLLFALFIRSSLKPGNSILIHSGTGGIGQAAIRLCLHYGCKVFTTVGTKEKREFLKVQFPKLTDNVIGNSHDTSFEQMIYRETHGRGVDFVLNSLVEEKLLASVRCLAHGGHFLEIGRFDLESNNPLHVLLLEKEATFSGIILNPFENSSVAIKLSELLLEGIANGSIQPLTRTIFDKEDLRKAFSYMMTGKHIGKVIIKIRDEEIEKTVTPLDITMRGMPRHLCDPEKTAIILGGLGGFGLELADWLILRGVRKLVLTSRQGVKTGYQASRIRIWKSYGVDVLISTIDTTTKSGCEQLIAEATQLGPIESIFNLAAILNDSIFENQTQQTFQTTFAPKAHTTRYLDEITREKCPQLRDFVVFSSISCGRGNGGQTNYGMANSVMERICVKRKEDGYPALAVEWGAIGDVGIVAKMQQGNKILEIGGTIQQPIASCLEVLDTLLKQDCAIVSSTIPATRKSADINKNAVVTVATLLGINDVKTVSLHSTLAELGMDSMTAVEIKQILEREFQVILSLQEIRKMTFAKLNDIQEQSFNDNDDKKEPVANDKSVLYLEFLMRYIVEATKSQITELPTKSNRHHCDLRRILLFPGSEGVDEMFWPLSKNLQTGADCVHYAIEESKDRIDKIASELLPKILNVVQKSEPFYFVSYSFGVAVAFEIVRCLEEKGYYGHLMCIDGGPELFQQMLLAKFGSDDNEDIFETNVLSHIMSMYIQPQVLASNKTAIVRCKSFDERLDFIAGFLPKDVHFEHIRKMTLVLFKRALALQHYKSMCRLKKTNVMLCKPSSLFINGLSDDYGLSEYCDQSIDVRYFYGNHTTILENFKLAETIDLWAGTLAHNTKPEINPKRT